MAFSSSSPSAQCSQTTSLTGPQLIPQAPRASEPKHPSQLVDLTLSDDEEPIAPEDHMHQVIELLYPRAISLARVEPDINERRKTADLTSYPSHCRKSHVHQRKPGKTQKGDCGDDFSPKVHVLPLSRRSDEVSLSSPPLLSIKISLQPDAPIITQRRGCNSMERRFSSFPFMSFPPEIRNLVYRFLLTTPRTPIELPNLTGRNGAAHRAQWAKCKTSRMRRKHKTIFLEILETCKQMHDEASGILYGCNVFKYRSNPGEGPKLVILPTRHLQLLKHIKISVVSREPNSVQDQRVADLVKQFVREGLRLETFEFTWYGWKRYLLKEGGLISQALQSLDVETQFTVKVTGEARMEKAMEEGLKRVIPRGVNVEIHRPVKESGEELSDEGEESVQ